MLGLNDQNKTTDKSNNETMKLEEINQKVLAKKGRLKRYRVSQNWTFLKNKRKFYQL